MGRIRRILDGMREPFLGQRTAFSQEGEDLILECFLYRQDIGFYIDVGAHHPTLYSNTYFYYCKGWRGINIDAGPGAMDAFRRLRPNDINVAAAVGNPSAERKITIFDEGAVTTLSPEFANRLQDEMGFKVIGSEKIRPVALSSLLDEHLPSGQEITFLSVDVEGLDLEVLQTNDWKRFRPHLVLAEHHGAQLEYTTVAEGMASPVAAYLDDLNYEMVAKTARTMVFRDRSSR